MKTFKIYDIAISILLFSIFFIASILNQDETFIYGYFVVGGWQVISMIIHALSGWFTNRGSKRFVYHWIVFVIICLGCLAFLIPIFWLIFYFLLFAAPLMAVYYIHLCWHETDFIRSREIVHLKN